MLSLLHDLVNIDSGSAHRQGVAAVGQRVAEFLHGYGVPVQWHQGNEGGDALTVGPGISIEGGQGHLLLMGHRTLFSQGVKLNGGRSGSSTGVLTAPASRT
jgi:glutamate carboxypeptidase